jgi:hypothetical protein
MPIDSHLPQADPFSLVPTFKMKNIPADPGGGGGAGGSSREDEEDNAGGQCQGLGTVRHHERLQGDVPGTDQASKLHVT